MRTSAQAQRVTWMSGWRASVRIDALRMARDRFLVGLAVYVVGVCFVIRVALPAVTRRLAGSVDLTGYYPLISSYLSVVTGALCVGIVGGMLLLETREERTIDALLVSPVAVRRLLSYEVASVFLAAAALIPLQAVIIGAGRPPLPSMLAASVAGAAFAPVVALAIARLANDKVEAFALMKAIGVVTFAPVGVWFAPASWHPVAALLPPFAASKAWWVAAAEAGTGLGWCAASLAINALLVLVLLRRWPGSTR